MFGQANFSCYSGITFYLLLLAAGAQAVQEVHRRLPGHAVQAGRHGRQDRLLQAHAQVLVLVKILIFNGLFNFYCAFFCIQTRC
jgi:hypothetical protein